MSDVAAASALPTSDQSEKLNSSLSPDQIDTAQYASSRHDQPATVANGPANMPNPAHRLDPGLPYPTKDADDRSQSSTTDKEDQELYGTEDPVNVEQDQPTHKSKATNDESDDDPFAGLEDFATMDLYDLANYTFGKKNEECKSRIMQDMPKQEISAALEKRYDERGMRRSVGAVILVHSHNFPHILLLQRSDGKGEYALPGGRLRPGESDEEGLQRKLASKLRPSDPISGDEEDQQLDVGDKRTISYLTCSLKLSVLKIASPSLLILLKILTNFTLHHVFFFLNSQFVRGMPSTLQGNTTHTFQRM